MWFWGILVFLVAVCLDYYRRTKKVNEMFPGPPSFPIIGNIHIGIQLRKDPVKSVRRLCDTYGKRFRIWFGYQEIIVLKKPNDAQIILDGRKPTKKSLVYRFMKPLGQGLITSDGDLWKKNRKVLTPAFNFSMLQNYLDIFQRNTGGLMEKLEKFVGKGNFDVYPIFRLCAMNIILECSMGRDVGSNFEEDSQEFLERLDTASHVVVERISSPWLWSDLIFSISSIKAKFDAGQKSWNDVTNSIINRRREHHHTTRNSSNEDVNGAESRESKVFLDILLESFEKGNISQEEMVDEIKTFMLAGHDTTASSLAFAIYCLAENPDCQQLAYEEQVNIFGYDADQAASLPQLQSMEYLEKVIKETMRLYCVVEGIGRNLSVNISLDERTEIPKGAEMFLHISSLHSDPTAWEKPEEFYPDHFEPEKIAKRHPYQYLPFGAGPRKCIGHKFANLEVKTVLSRILRSFELLPGDPHVPLKLVFRIANAPKNGVNIRLRKRNQSDFRN